MYLIIKGTGINLQKIITYQKFNKQFKFPNHVKDYSDDGKNCALILPVFYNEGIFSEKC